MLSGSDGKKDDCSFMTRQSHRSVCSASDFFTNSQSFLDSLIESLPTARMFVLVNYRPEYQHGWGNKTYYTELRVDPLPAESAEQLLHSLLGNDLGLEPVKRLLIARTEGNPFFLEESVHTLVETKALVGEHSAYRIAKPIEGTQVPATVQAVLE